MAKKMYIVDAMAMAFRSFYAFGVRPLTTPSGTPVSAVYGSAIFLNKLLTTAKPDYFLIATDSIEKTFRHDLYPGYKANRSDMPQDLAAQLPLFFRLLEAYGCKVLKQPGVEADDLIGSMVKKFAGPDLEIFIVSGDKDFMQLIDDHTFLYTPKKGDESVLVDRTGVHTKFGCLPEQVIDCLALIGDSSDNVPGVPGIGEKGAAKLISEFHSLDGIYENLESIRNQRQRDGLANNKELAYLSKQLVTIKTDIPLAYSLEDFACHPETALINSDLLQLFEELEFQSLISKIYDLKKSTPGKLPSPSLRQSQQVDPGYSIHESKAEYVIVNTRPKLDNLLKELQQTSLLCFDTETTGLDIINSKPIGISLATEAGRAAYLPLVDKHLEGLTPAEAMEAIVPILLRSDIKKVGHNIKFDLQMLRNINLDVSHIHADTMIIDYLLDPISRQHGLDACCLRHLNYKKIPTSELIGLKGERSMLEVPLEELGRYACEDADLTLQLYQKLYPRLAEHNLQQLFDDVEMPLIPILAKMEQTGIYLDAEELLNFSVELDISSKTLVSAIYQEAGLEFNINSTKQLQDVLFEKLRIHETLGLKYLKKTKTGYSTDESVLSKMVEHPLPRLLLEYRSITKLKNTYVDVLPQLINKTSNRLHTSFHQTGTATGRLSSSDPNLQNIPIRTTLGKKMRKAFRTSQDDWAIISADYSQVELRLLAHIADEKALTQAFQEGADIHRSTAAKIFGLDPEHVDPVMRSRAKAINFGIIYGMGPRRLASETGVSMADAQSFIKRYFETFPAIRNYIDTAITSARDRGYSETILGRRRPIPELQAGQGRNLANAENIAVNSPIQGSAADLIKLAMIKVDEQLTATKSRARLLLQVHDELVLECPQQDVQEVRTLVQKCMEEAMQLQVPLAVEVGFGANWLEAH